MRKWWTEGGGQNQNFQYKAQQKAKAKNPIRNKQKNPKEKKSFPMIISTKSLAVYMPHFP